MRVIDALAHLDDKRVVMRRYGLVFVLVLDGMEKQTELLAQHLRQASQGLFSIYT